MSHDHHHPPAQGREHEAGPPSEHEILSRAMQELLEEKGIITAERYRETYGGPWVGIHRADLQQILSGAVGLENIHLNKRLQ